MLNIFGLGNGILAARNFRHSNQIVLLSLCKIVEQYGHLVASLAPVDRSLTSEKRRSLDNMKLWKYNCLCVYVP